MLWHDSATGEVRWLDEDPSYPPALLVLGDGAYRCDDLTTPWFVIHNNRVYATARHPFGADRDPWFITRDDDTPATEVVTSP